jgi:hypothetical protein
VNGIPSEDELAGVFEETTDDFLPDGFLSFFLRLDGGEDYCGLWTRDDPRAHVARHSHDGTFEGTLEPLISQPIFPQWKGAWVLTQDKRGNLKAWQFPAEEPCLSGRVWLWGGGHLTFDLHGKEPCQPPHRLLVHVLPYQYQDTPVVEMEGSQQASADQGFSDPICTDERVLQNRRIGENTQVEQK